MKHANLRKAVEKFAMVEEKLGKNDHYLARCGNQVISWYISWYEKDSQECSLVRVRGVEDTDDISSDYIAGAFYDTIKSAIHALTYDFRKQEIA